MSAIPIDYYLILSIGLFLIGVCGVIFRRNVLIVLMSIELMLNGVNISFITFSRFKGDMLGQVVVFFSIAIAAAEAALGLAIVIALFSHFKSINIDDARTMRS